MGWGGERKSCRIGGLELKRVTWFWVLAEDENEEAEVYVILIGSYK